ncbi:type IX secretion system membrane protein PorP/SprF [Aequorivita sp. Q41]|uniref:PorP/SprF family type IX secretion system membrane protein n=1 Tax=Aequorivita sp. Q41 TaxID=3153300 RepID=UPI00324220FF
MKHSYLTLLILILLGTFTSKAQQDPQYTQYMYNTQVVNPAYAGNREALSFGLLYRTQWVNFGDGAPNTGTFTVNSPVGNNMGLGLSVVNDRIGPSVETNFNIDYSYSINVSESAKVSFGLKAGLDILDVDFSKLNILDGNDPYFSENNIDNKLQPQIGAGIYYNNEKFYAGLSVPNFLTTKHFDKSSIENTQVETTAAERMHYFLIAGYVFDIGENLKFKPATLFKMVSGSPLQADVSANFLLYDKLTLGAAYRWSAAMSGLVGFQATDNIFIGFAYDYQTTDIEAYSDGSYEIMLRFELFNRPERVLTPRFF